ncbi:SPOR domain-containing protein [Meiothermus sp. QL-1]|uniref:SPOR domain-containing protein n=1 Tax=Meiothermus sp. QL-1 TaxID=2058095 RepID=UPI000E0BB240|nr:SPOR domain-containing protein [Meiothermus sp. QL-1]RDI96205.1 SPOR domain-containing protein [Meiothermus sp. QL-1]
MGWLRTNWLDALIFLLVALIMIGVVLFLTGVNPFAPTTQAPPQPQTASPPQNPAPPAQSESEPVITLLPVPQAPPKPVPAPPKASEKPAPSESPAPRPNPAPASPLPQARRPSLAAEAGGSWWVVVGAFSQPENAARLAQSLRAEGYPVRLEAAENLTRVWVGPYASEGRARSVASTLSHHGPRVTRQAPTTPPPSPTRRYLQVGAFRNPESAQPVIEAVRAAGYPVVLVEEGGLVKVRVGPLEDTATAAAALRARGLEVLEVR